MKLDPQLREKIINFCKEHPAMRPKEGGAKFGISAPKYAAIYKKVHGCSYKAYMERLPEGSITTTSGRVKTGLEMRGDHIVINWTTKTVITDLGQWGDMVCSFDMHFAVQRMYVTAHGNETAAIVAMHFDFPHAKAVHRYAKLHGFTKSSIPQTDLELEMGLEIDEAIEENLQAMKRKIYKGTEKKKWAEIQKGYNNWINFHHNVLKPFSNHVEAHLPTYVPPTFSIRCDKHKNSYACVSGITDAHYLKLCYDHEGNVVYNQEIARKAISNAVSSIIEDALTFGNIEKFFITLGNDNLHIDNAAHTTTAGTSQVAQSVGNYALEVGPYLDINLDYIESFAQTDIPVEVLIVPGNHDERTSFLLGTFLKRLFRKHKRVTIVHQLHSRLYTSYGNNGLVFTHGTGFSEAKFRREIHKIIMGEAKSRGLNMKKLERYLVFTGHLHAESIKDLGGFVQHFLMPSLSATEYFDDNWHQNSGYVGRSVESAGYLLDAKTGRKAIFYV